MCGTGTRLRRELSRTTNGEAAWRHADGAIPALQDEQIRCFLESAVVQFQAILHIKMQTNSATQPATLIYNPHAGFDAWQESIAACACYWEEHGWQITVHETAYPGHATELAATADAADEHLADLAAQLGSAYEPAGVDAAYRMASQGRKAITPLAAALTGADANAARNAGYGLSAVGATALGELVDALGHSNETARMYAAFALGEIGGDAVESSPAVARLMADPSVEVRRTAVEALGQIKSPANATIPALIDGLGDEDAQVRFTAALSLQRIGPDAAGAVPALARALRDENRYVRANAVDALRRIGTTEALTAALDHLSAHRWCPTTTTDDTF